MSSEEVKIIQDDRYKLIERRFKDFKARKYAVCLFFSIIYNTYIDLYTYIYFFTLLVPKFFF